MPLFPAYSGSGSPEELQKPTQSTVPVPAIEPTYEIPNTDWLTNASFPASTVTTQLRSPRVTRHEEKVEYITEFLTEAKVETTEDEEDEKRVKPKSERGSERDKQRKKEKKRRRRSSSTEDRHRSKSKKKKKKKDKKKTEEINLPQPRLPKNVVFIDNTGLKPSEAFRIDREGDKQNLAFPNMHYAFIPKYFVLKHRLGGSTPTPNKKLVKRKKPPRYYSKRTAKIMKNSDLPPILVDVKQGPGALHCFIPMNPVKPRNAEEEKVLEDANPLGIYDPGTLHYLQGKGLESETSSTPVNQEVSQLRQRNKEFNEQLRFKPSDVQLWLKFVDFQDKMAGVENYEEESKPRDSRESEAEAKDQKFRKLSPKALLERKVSILDRAIQSNPRSVELLMTRMRIGSEFWDATTLQKNWRQILFLHPTNVQIWRHYIAMTAANFSEFSVSAITRIYATALQKLIQAQSPTFASRDKPQYLEEEIIDLFTDLCLFLHKARHSEKAIALYQALIELNFHRPTSTKTPLKELLAKMELFWDTGAPRFGEEGALGWAQVLETQKCGVRILPPSADEEDDLVKSGLPRYQVWLGMEKLRQKKHFLPWTVNPEVGDELEDKERLVDWDDLSSFLFLVDRDKENVRFRLLQGFLCSLKVPLPKLQSVRWYTPCQASADSLEDINLFKSSGSAREWPSSQKLEADWFADEVYCGVVRTIFLQGFKLLGSDFQASFVAWWMTWERHRLESLESGEEKTRSWKETKKLVKNVIKDYGNQQNNVLLYTFYAKLEWAMGNRDECLRILQMLLTTLPAKLLDVEGNPTAVHEHGLYLWDTYIKCCMWRWQAGEDKYWKLAQAALVQLGCGERYDASFQISPPGLLKAKRSFEAVLGHVNLDQVGEVDLVNLLDSVTESVLCSVWFLFITDTYDVAVKEVQHLLRREAKKSLRLNQTNRLDLKAIRCHFRRELLMTRLFELQDLAPKKHSKLHETLLVQALEEYIGNVEFLARFIESEGSCRVVDSLWCRITSKARQGDSFSAWTVTACCLALLHRDQLLQEAEFKNWEQEKLGPFIHNNGLRYKLRGFLESCLQREENSHCPLLWRLYLYLWHISGDTKKLRANFYRAIRDCPSAKVLYLDVVEYVPNMLKEVCDLLNEKELRLHFLLEELDVMLEPEEDEEPEPIPDWDEGIKREESDDTNSETSISGDEVETDNEDG